MSASDDHTIRVWNWISRTCVATLTGHSHYVMCARFHPRDDLVVSASLDQTVRVWDLGPLRRRSVRGAGGIPPLNAGTNSPLAALRAQAQRFAAGGGGAGARSGAGGEVSGDAVVKHIFESHDRGVNWATFHPTMPLIISAADDRSMKLWRMADGRAWEVDTMRGHSNNVSCALFHPHCDLIVSNSEDRSIRVWDGTKRLALSTYRRESERFWILAAHPHQNLMAAGHDRGLVVFKLERERPPYAPAGSGLVFYGAGRDLRRAVLGAGIDARVYTDRRTSSTYQFNAGARSVAHNAHQRATEVLLAHTLAEGGQYTLIDVAASMAAAAANGRADTPQGTGLSVCFLSQSRFVVLDRNRSLAIKDMANKTTKRVPLPAGYDRADSLFASSQPGRILIRAEDKVCLFETASGRVLGEVSGLRRVRYVSWSPDGRFVALVTRVTVTLADRDLNHIATVREAVRVKSACWDEKGVLLFNTYTHLKYLVPEVAAHGASGPSTPADADGAAAAASASSSADADADAAPPAATTSKAAADAAERTADAVGIVRALPAVVYLVEARDGQLHVLDRKRSVRALTYDATEPQFKRSLARREYGEVVRAIRGGSMCGQAVLSYLQRAGYPEIAMHFVADTATKFGLALECGDLDVALDCAEKMGDADLWLRLARESTQRGNVRMAEAALQHARARDKLAFLYLATGERGTLRRMHGLARKVGDPMGEYQAALALGDAAARVDVLVRAGQLALACACASLHGLHDQAARVRAMIEDSGGTAPDVAALAADIPGVGTTACTPPPCVAPSAGNWPQLEGARSVFNTAVLTGQQDVADEAAGRGGRAPGGAAAAALAADDDDAGGAWGGDDLGLDDDDAAAGGAGGASSAVKALRADAGAAAASSGGPGAAAAWGGGDSDLDLDLGDDLDGPDAGAAGAAAAGAASASGWVAPTPGPGFASRWVSSGSSVPADHAAAGGFETAADLLRRQLGLTTLEPLADALLATRQAAVAAVPTLPGLPALSAPILAENPASSSAPSRPAAAVTVPSLVADLSAVYTAFQSGDFAATAAACDVIFARIPLAAATSRAQEREVREVLEAAREYKLACTIELARKATPPSDPAAQKRVLELAAYLTHCRLQPPHRILTLDLAMSISFKLKNFASAAQFARRLVETPQATAPAFAARVAKANKVITRAQAMGRNAVPVDYDPRNPFEVCAASLTPVYRGQPSVTSPFSGARYRPEYAGEVCRVDGCAAIGEETTGLVCYRADRPAAGAAAAAAASSAAAPAETDGFAGESW